VASPVGVNRDIVIDGKTGLLAITGEEWRRQLELLIADSYMRRALGAEGRRRAVAKYSLTAHAPTVVGILKAAAEQDNR